jgi:hypothetical protein
MIFGTKQSNMANQREQHLLMQISELQHTISNLLEHHNAMMKQILMLKQAMLSPPQDNVLSVLVYLKMRLWRVSDRRSIFHAFSSVLCDLKLEQCSSGASLVEVHYFQGRPGPFQIIYRMSDFPLMDRAFECTASHFYK